MRKNRFVRHRFWSVFILALFVVPGASVAQEDPPLCPDPLPEPYVFLLLDTSGSMNWSPECSQAQYDAGECSFLCPTGECFVPLQGDDPASKFYQLKEGLQTALAGQTGLLFGFGSYNQDTLRAGAKHWIYEAQGGGPAIPGWGPYPAAGAREVFGLNWGCDTGSGDNEIGCYSTKPADLPDAWEVSRVQRLPKAGSAFNQSVIFYLRSGTTYYKVTYSPAAGSVPGAPAVSVNVRIDRCNHSGCTAVTLVGQTSISWARVSEFLSWDNGSLYRSNPQMSFFSDLAVDAPATNTCTGWDPNTDTASDLYSGYNLRWPTNASDPRGSFFTVGDVIPFDWFQDHNLDIQARLAPNLAINPTAAPDFGIASYLQDIPLPGQSYLRLKDERARPLIATGSTPLGTSLQAFRKWYSGCATGVCPSGAGWKGIAAANDPYWYCRRKFLVVLADGEETCNTDPCATADALHDQENVMTYMVAFGFTPGGGSSSIACIAANGGTGSPYLPQTKTELIDALNTIFTEMKNP